MKKHKLEAALAAAGNVPDAGTVEAHFDTLATEPRLPDVAIGSKRRERPPLVDDGERYLHVSWTFRLERLFPLLQPRALERIYRPRF